MKNKREIGSYYEDMAAVYLGQQGYEILEKNYRCSIGEIDLIARHQEYLVFIEVKFRQSQTSGVPQESVTWRKQKSIIRTAGYYLLKHGLKEDTPCRFDVVSILGEEIQLIENAFEC